MSWFEDSMRHAQGFPMINFISNLPQLSDGVDDSEASASCSAGAPSRVYELLILSMYMPDNVVRVVEQTVGSLDLHFGIRDDDHILQVRSGNFRELRKMVKALRGIRNKKWTLDIRYVMQNLQEFKALLGRLLDDLKLCRKLRFPENDDPPLPHLPTRNPHHPPAPNPNDLTQHADALELVLNDLEAGDYVVMLLAQFDRFDEYIFTVHQLIDFLS